MQTTVRHGQGGGGVENWENFADTLYGWPLVMTYKILNRESPEKLKNRCKLRSEI